MEVRDSDDVLRVEGRREVLLRYDEENALYEKNNTEMKEQYTKGSGYCSVSLYCKIKYEYIKQRGMQLFFLLMSLFPIFMPWLWAEKINETILTSLTGVHEIS